MIRVRDTMIDGLYRERRIAKALVRRLHGKLARATSAERKSRLAEEVARAKERQWRLDRRILSELSRGRAK